MIKLQAAALTLLLIALLLPACASRQLETETTISPSAVASPIGSNTRVVKDQIPAEGER